MPNLRRSFLTTLGALTGAGVATAAGARDLGSPANPKSDAAEKVVSVADFPGLDGTGRSPSDEAFRAALQAVAGQVHAPAFGENPNNIGGARIVVPRGTYLLTRPGVLFNARQFPSRTCGFTIEGDGPPGTVVILYKPGRDGSGALFNNQDKALGVRLRNLQFHGMDARSDLITSVSSGGAQDYAFDDCMFTGTWRYGVDLTGDNCNSEWKFWRCTWAGTWDSFLHVGEKNTSDQFLNYWFEHCRYWCSSPWIDMRRGGHIKLTDCDVSGYEPSAQTYLFNLRGNNHAMGVCSFKAHGLRVEQKSRNAGLMLCEWEQGNVGFRECDFGSQGFRPFAADTVSAVFSPGNTAGAQIVFDNCQIMGRHQYVSGNTPAAQGRAVYRNCDFVNYTYPDEALMFSEANNLAANRRVVTLEGCRGKGAANVYADAEIGWHVAASAAVRTKVMALRVARGQRGSMPTAILPLNAVVTRVVFDTAGDRGSYAVVSGDATKLSVVKASGPAEERLPFRCNTRQRCTLTLTPGSDPGAEVVALIEYVG